MPRRLCTAALSLALVGALAACGGSKSSTSSQTTGSNGTAASNVGTKPTSDTVGPVDTNFSGQGSDALCKYATDLESSNINNDLQSSDLKTSLTKLEEILNNIKDKAPDEIKSDVDTMLTAYTKMIDIYKKYDYDSAKLIAAAANDPNLTAQFAALSSAEITSASQRVSAYFTNVCGVTTATT